jgi:hypothetical protein
MVSIAVSVSRQPMNPIKSSIPAGALAQVISEHYTHLTQDTAYDAMLSASAGGRAG